MELIRYLDIGSYSYKRYILFKILEIYYYVVYFLVLEYKGYFIEFMNFRGLG